MGRIHKHVFARGRVVPALVVGCALVFAVSVTALAQTYEVTADGAALREGPSRKNKVMRSLQKGERVLKLGAEKGYFRVRTEQDALEGYIGPSLLMEVKGGGIETQDYNEFIAELLDQEGARERDRPGLYPYEAQLDFLRSHGRPVFGALVLLFAAVAAGTVGVYLLMKLGPGLEKVLPPSLTGTRRSSVKTAAVVAGAYAVARAAAYFLDLGLHLAELEENAVLVTALIIPRLAIGVPVAVIDSLGSNWVIGIAVLILFALIVRPWAAGSPAFMETGFPDGSFLERPPTGAGAGAGVSGPTRTQAKPQIPAAESGGDTRIIAEEE